MGACLRRFERRKTFEATGDDVVRTIMLVNDKHKDNVVRKLFTHVITLADTDNFVKLQTTVSCVSSDNKKKLHQLLLEAKLMFWNPKERREFRFWE